LAIHGLDTADAGDVKEILTLMLQHIGLGSDARIEVYRSEVTSSDGKATREEYIEVVSTSPGEIRLILASLEKIHIGIDVEWSLIGGFRSASDMR
jgi:hypothetical protein